MNDSTTIIFDSLRLGSTWSGEPSYRGYEGYAASSAAYSDLRASEGTAANNVELMSGLASNLLQLAPPKAAIAIPNGWNCDRFGFVLTLTLTEQLAVSTTVTRYVITGWTDMLSMGLNNTQLDPTTMFHISNVTAEPLNTSSTRKQWDCLATIDGGTMTDVINNSPLETFRVNADVARNVNDGSNPTHMSNRLLPQESKPSSVRSRTPTGYISEMVNCISNVSNDSVVSSFGGTDFTMSGGNEAFAQAMPSVDTVIISELNRVSNHQVINFRFPASMLIALDPTLIQSRTDYILDYQAKASEYLDNTGLECKIATSMFDHVSSIASMLCLLQIDFTTTNMLTLEQSMNVPGWMDNQLFTTVGSSICTNPNTSPANVASLFAHTLSSQGGSFLTENGTVRFEMNVRFEMFSECTIDIRLETSRNPVTFSFGAFASNLTSPLLSVVNPTQDYTSGMSDSTASLTSIIAPLKDSMANRLLTTGTIRAFNEEIIR